MPRKTPRSNAVASDRAEASISQAGIESLPPPKDGKDSIITTSLFAGCGGMDLGFTGGFTYRDEYYEELPFNVVKAYDNDEKCIETYNQNLGDRAELADLSTLSPENMPEAECLVGGFPCQEFSSCGPKGGLGTKRGQLYQSFVEYMNAREPLVVIAENVLHLERMQEGVVLRTIQRDLEASGRGYRFQALALYAPDFGVPQTRSRLFFIGVRNDLIGQPVAPEPTHYMSYRSIDWAIADLIGVTDESVPNQGQYFRANKAKNGNGQGDEVSRPGEPAYTVRSNPKSRVQFHYSLPRRLTIRECARIQTFPDDFVFPHSATTNMKQIGNAVPPVLAHRVAQSIAKYFDSIPTALRLTQNTDVTPTLGLGSPRALDPGEAQAVHG